MVFSCYSHKFLALPKFWASFLHPTSPSQPVTQKNPVHQAHPYYSLHVHLFSWTLSFTCLTFLVQLVWLLRSHDKLFIICVTDSVMALRNDVTDGMEVKEGLFWRPASLQCILGGRPLGLGSIVVIFSKGRIHFILFLFSGFWQYSFRSIQKRLFRDFINFFEPAPKFWTFFTQQIFSFRKSVCTIGKIYSIPVNSDGFRTFKKSLSVSINQSTNLLTLVVCNCSPHRSALKKEN